jgi:hypothetical protein
MTSPALLAPRFLVGENVVRAIVTMHRVLASIGWDPGKEDSSMTVVVDFGPPHRPISGVVIEIEPRAECLIATFEFGGYAESGTRDEVARFATRANWELLAGNFELDLDSGEVRFRSSVPFTGGELPKSMIHSVIGNATGLTTFATFTAAIRIAFAVPSEDQKIQTNTDFGEHLSIRYT